MLAVTKLLCEHATIELLVLFGSYARGDWVEDVENLYFSDYDLLAVVRKATTASRRLIFRRSRSRRATGHFMVTALEGALSRLDLDLEAVELAPSTLDLSATCSHDDIEAREVARKTLKGALEATEQDLKRCQEDLKPWQVHSKGAEVSGAATEVQIRASHGTGW